MRTLHAIGASPSNSTLQQLIQEAITHVESWKGDRHIVLVNSGSDLEHLTASDECCLCDPVIVYTDLVTGYRVYLHRTLEA